MRAQFVSHDVLGLADVASMLQAALRRPGWVAVAIGFNPIEAIKSVRVDGWASSFHAVLMVR